MFRRVKVRHELITVEAWNGNDVKLFFFSLNSPSSSLACMKHPIFRKLTFFFFYLQRFQTAFQKYKQNSYLFVVRTITKLVQKLLADVYICLHLFVDSLPNSSATVEDAYMNLINGQS